MEPLGDEKAKKKLNADEIVCIATNSCNNCNKYKIRITS